MSFFSDEELNCLASWKEGSLRYLVATVNQKHIHNDEARFKCFVYQRQRHHGSREMVYKMAQSEKASCVGLWSVDEGVKTFKMTKSKFNVYIFYILVL